MTNIDVVIPIAAQDINSLRFSLPYIKTYLPWKKIIVIANKKIRENIESLNDIEFCNEDELFDGMTFQSIKEIISQRYPKAIRRTGWYFQQFLKYAYAFKCKDDYYLTWDSDTIPLKQIRFLDDVGKPYLDYVPLPYGDNDYFKLLAKLPPDFNHKSSNLSFITEHMVFHVETVKALINEINRTDLLKGNNLYERILSAIDVNKLNLSGFSEFETYAAFVQNTSSLYTLRRWRNLRNGKFYVGNKPSKEQLEWIKNSGFDVASLEDYDYYFPLNRYISESSKVRAHITFKQYYNVVNPFYKVYYDMRLALRSFIKK